MTSEAVWMICSSVTGPSDCAKQDWQLFIDERGTSGDLTEVWVCCECGRAECSLAQTAVLANQALGEPEKLADDGRAFTSATSGPWAAHVSARAVAPKRGKPPAKTTAVPLQVQRPANNVKAAELAAIPFDFPMLSDFMLACFHDHMNTTKKMQWNKWEAQGQ